MAHRTTLNDNQLTVLRWIEQGCPEGVLNDPAHRISAAALRRRGLVATRGRGPSWTANLTDTGREYLERTTRPDPPRPRQPNMSVTQQLVDDVLAAGGSLRVPRKSYYERSGVDYQQRARLAERHGKVPEGKRLVVRLASSEELELALDDLLPGAPRKVTAVSVPDKVGRYHPVVRRLKQQSGRHEVSRAALPRALRILNALVTEAERRGHGVETSIAEERKGYGRSGWSGVRDGHVVLRVTEFSAAVRLSEEGLSSRAHWERKNRYFVHRLEGGSETRRRPLTEYEQRATGRLVLELVPAYSLHCRPGKWADRQRWTLEEKLSELLFEVETRAAEETESRREAERREAERRREWEAAMQRARERYIEHYRGEALRGEVRRWREAQEILAYCDAAESTYPDVPATAEWISWARRYAGQLDPLRAALETPSVPESAPAAELRPFLEGWNPRGPEGSGR
ncbi:MAG: hypothetical protein M3355_07470 [Actinomycetota bacterium]|nr:hypothetical protein [Actinomycetota bacterium]